MPSIPFGWGKAFGFALVIWIVGFVWGSVVFMVPVLKAIPPIPYVSRYPAISFPVLVAFAALAYLFAGLQLKAHEEKGAAGLRQGLVFFLVNIAMDTLVLVWMFHGGWQFFASLTVVLAYVILIIVPWLTGRAMESNE